MSLSPYVRWVSGLNCVDGARPLHPLTIRRAQALAVAAHLPAVLWVATTFVTGYFLFQLHWAVSLLLGVLAGVVIFYVERLVILSPPTPLASRTRLALGLVVALLGATSTDIIIFDREIKAQLARDQQSRAVSVLESEASRLASEAAAARSRWLAAQAKAQCEADGTCGSRVASVGPVYKELAKHANALKSEYMALEGRVRDLESKRLSAAQSTPIVNETDHGLLARVSALFRFFLSEPHAFGIYLLILVLIVLIEGMTVITKLAFPKTVDDEIEAANASVMSEAAARYIRLMNTEPGRAQLLVNSTYSF